jgi:peptide/nickel transport system substrate-binding protein
MFRRNAPRILTVACVLLALVATGCGNSGGGGSTAAGGGGGRGELLTIAIGSFPTSYDPGLGLAPAYYYSQLAYDPLIVFGPDGRFSPGLATSWGYGPRNMSFSMRLRPHVRFSDGERLDAEAVKTWIQHVKTVPGGTGAGYLRDLGSIEVTGPLSLTVHFRKPTPLLEQVFSQKVQVGLVGSPRAAKAGTLRTEPVGTGQYVLDRAATVARDHYTYVANPDYWDKGAIRWKKVVVKTISNPSAALQALKTGQVQIVVAQPATSIEAAKQAGLHVAAPASLILGLQLSDRDGRLLKPLGDVRVRQAINYAIDREPIARLLAGDYGEVTHQFAAKGDDAYDPALEERYPYDVAMARRLLAEAGYADGFTLPVLSFNLLGQDKTAEALAGQLARVGITVKPTITTNVDDYVKGMEDTSRFPAVTLSWGRLPAVTNYQILWGPDASPTNAFRSRDPRIDALYAKLTAAPPEEADAIAREMMRVLVDEAWFAPVATTPEANFYSDEVAGVNVTPERPQLYTNELRPAN